VIDQVFDTMSVDAAFDDQLAPLSFGGGLV
jgi:hypothetical protein